MNVVIFIAGLFILVDGSQVDMPGKAVVVMPKGEGDVPPHNPRLHIPAEAFGDDGTYPQGICSEAGGLVTCKLDGSILTVGDREDGITFEEPGKPETWLMSLKEMSGGSKFTSGCTSSLGKSLGDHEAACLVVARGSIRAGHVLKAKKKWIPYRIPTRNNKYVVDGVRWTLKPTGKTLALHIRRKEADGYHDYPLVLTESTEAIRLLHHEDSHQPHYREKDYGDGCHKGHEIFHTAAFFYFVDKQPWPLPYYCQEDLDLRAAAMGSKTASKEPKGRKGMKDPIFHPTGYEATYCPPGWWP